MLIVRLRAIVRTRGAKTVVLGHPDNIKPLKKSLFAPDGFGRDLGDGDFREMC